MGAKCQGQKRDAKSTVIEETLREDKKTFARHMKLLLLGPGESGKSTIAKQVKVIYMGGFTDEDRQVYVGVVQRNIIETARGIVAGADSLEIKLSGVDSDLLRQLREDVEYETVITKVTELQAFWSNKNVKKVLKRRSEIQIQGAPDYFFPKIEEVVQEGYVPSDQDILQCRVQTTGVIETEVTDKANDITFSLVDVGGQRSERRKWMHCFEDVTAILFVTAISAFDQVLYEDHSTNRMHEALQLFASMCQSKWFANSNYILFLNKCDLFREKLENGASITSAFPDYAGDNSYEQSLAHITNAFQKLTSQLVNKIHVHETTATDTEIVRKIFKTLIEIIISNIFSALSL
eukprot:TRINITY_DN887_c2_g1_i1.p1 TRINITY_DN887_c2_g1~~TRINITY_DN887_c2_g1_i1.p1  ORF type:complete len:349 (-),score=66.34 TRINITY_DN887_c2_g1_i1:210-1256(-)